MDQEQAKNLAAQRLETQLARAAVIRKRSRVGAAREARLRLRTWQAARLARTHADLLAHPKYAAAARFFLVDLYGPQDHAMNEEAILRVLPLMKKGLPSSGLDSIADAIELDALSESLDADMALRVEGGAPYGEAYRQTGRRDDRIRQIELMRHLGAKLHKLTTAPLIGLALKALRTPAQVGGFGDMHGFLERGYSAFRQAGDARVFVEIVARREEQISSGLFSGDDSPLMA